MVGGDVPFPRSGRIFGSGSTVEVLGSEGVGGDDVIGVSMMLARDSSRRVGIVVGSGSRDEVVDGTVSLWLVITKGLNSLDGSGSFDMICMVSIFGSGGGGGFGFGLFIVDTLSGGGSIVDVMLRVMVIIIIYCAPPPTRVPRRGGSSRGLRGSF